MGAGMASNLLKAGFNLTVYNRTASKAQPLVEVGAHLALTPADAARGAEIIISMLADDAASRRMWIGHDGALAASQKGAILIESSTVSPAWIAELSATATEHHVELLDAPVTGSRMQAESGQLSFLVGGSDEALASATPVLKAMSKEIIHLGAIGSGAKMKKISRNIFSSQARTIICSASQTTAGCIG